MIVIPVNWVSQFATPLFSSSTCSGRSTYENTWPVFYILMPFLWHNQQYKNHSWKFKAIIPNKKMHLLVSSFLWTLYWILLQCQYFTNNQHIHVYWSQKDHFAKMSQWTSQHWLEIKTDTVLFSDRQMSVPSITKLHLVWNKSIKQSDIKQIWTICNTCDTSDVGAADEWEFCSERLWRLPS